MNIRVVKVGPRAEILCEYGCYREEAIRMIDTHQVLKPTRIGTSFLNHLRDSNGREDIEKTYFDLDSALLNGQLNELNSPPTAYHSSPSHTGLTTHR